ncbi:MAG: hypothetical protein ACTHQQ_00015 [Solirubrobacteraceae bacterium]
MTLEHAGGTTELVEAGWVIGAGGAHSLTRASMAEGLAGSTYPGTALVADVRVRGGPPRDGAAIIASAEGYVLRSPGTGGSHSSATSPRPSACVWTGRRSRWRL